MSTSDPSSERRRQRTSPRRRLAPKPPKTQKLRITIGTSRFYEVLNGELPSAILGPGQQDDHDGADEHRQQHDQGNHLPSVASVDEARSSSFGIVCRTVGYRHNLVPLGFRRGGRPAMLADMAGSILGNRVLRTEDPALLTGAARFVYDFTEAETTHAVFVRSIVAHGLINGIDTTAAAGSPGVIAVYTAADLGIEPHHGFVKVDDAFARSPLAADRVRFVGDPIAVVIAETFEQGVDAAELVIADITPLPAVIDPESAFDDGVELIYPDKGDNLAISSTDPDVDVLADADRVDPWPLRQPAGRRRAHGTQLGRRDAGRRRPTRRSTRQHRCRTSCSVSSVPPSASTARPSTSSLPMWAEGSAPRPVSTPNTRWLPRLPALTGRAVTWTETRSEDRCCRPPSPGRRSSTSSSA